MRGAHETKLPLGPQDSTCGSDPAPSTSPAFQVPSPSLMEQQSQQTSDRPRECSLTECGQDVQSCRKPTLPGFPGSSQGHSGREAVRQAGRGWRVGLEGTEASPGPWRLGFSLRTGGLHLRADADQGLREGPSGPGTERPAQPEVSSPSAGPRAS